jgi:MerR family transcriptional regulator, light-induced transcriptional regulator
MNEGTAMNGTGQSNGGSATIPSTRTMPKHPIGVVASRTGLTPDVLRVWERRYHAVEPQRTEKGQRLYSDEDVERLQLLQRATSQGRSIGQLVKLAASELRELVRSDNATTAPQPAADAPPPPHAAAYIELALERALRLDADGLESLMRRLSVLWGTAAFLDAFAAPLFRRIGEEWHERRMKPAQEHLATGVMRNVLSSLTTELSPHTAAPKLVVTTPAQERHEIGALLVASAAAASGWRVTYLGPDLPAADIAEAAAESGARAVGISIVFPQDDAYVLAEALELRRLLPPHVELLAGGRAAAALAPELTDAGIIVMFGLPELRDWLRRNI